MSSNVKDKVLLVGPGNIGLDYIKILKTFDIDIDVVGRSKKSSDSFSHKARWFVHSGGVKSYISKNNKPPKYAIVAVNENQLSDVTLSLINYGVKNILLEKPGALNHSDLLSIKNMSVLNSCSIYIGYNRRFYKSVKKCREFLSKSKGPVNVHFEFTEWPHTIDFNQYTKGELEKFFLCNSSHVVDLVFHLFGKPKVLNSYTNGSLDWHPSASIFSGSGKTEKDVLFTYNANWGSAGRWGVEISLTDYKLILKPLEKLFIQRKGSLDIDEINLNNDSYKPGLYEEIKSFFENNNRYLCSIEEQLINFDWYYKIANYEKRL